MKQFVLFISFVTIIKITVGQIVSPQDAIFKIYVNSDVYCSYTDIRPSPEANPPTGKIPLYYSADKMCRHYTGYNCNKTNSCGINLSIPVNSDNFFLRLCNYYIVTPSGIPSVEDFALSYEFDINSMVKGHYYSFNIEHLTPNIVCSYNTNNAKGTISIGITPPRPNKEINVYKNSSDTTTVTWSLENNKIYVEATPHGSITDSLDKYWYQIEYSFDNINWMKCNKTNFNTRTSIILPNYENLYLYKGNRYILLRSRTVKNNGILGSISESPWTPNVLHVVYPKFNINVGPVSVCSGDFVDSLTFKCSDFNNSLYDKINVYMSSIVNGNEAYTPITELFNSNDVTITNPTPTNTSYKFLYKAYKSDINLFEEEKRHIIEINALPNAYSVTGGGSYCSDGDGVVIELSGSQTGVNYQLYCDAAPVGLAKSGNGDTISFGKQKNAGTYTVVATNATTYCTSNMTGSVAVTVNTPSTISLTRGTQSPTVCKGSPITDIVFTFGGSATNASVKYLPSGLSAEVDTTAKTVKISGTPTAGGTYTVTTSGHTAPCTAATDSGTITVNALPTAEITSSDNDNKFCAGSSVTFKANAGLSSYQFMVGGNPMQTGTSNAFTTTSLANGNVVSVMVTDSNGCSSMSSGITNTVNALPNPSINVIETSGTASNDGTICVGDQVTLTASGGTSYKWNNGQTTQSITVSPSVTTTYTVEVTNENGCKDSVSRIVTVNNLPTATISSSDTDSKFCSGTSVTFTADTGMSTYKFMVGGSPVQTGVSNAYASTTLSNGNVVSVMVTDSKGCSSTSKGITNTVYALPFPTISGPKSVCANSEGNIYSTEQGMSNYSWSVSGGTITSDVTSSSSSVTITWDSAGTGHVMVNYTNGNGCSAASQTDKAVTINALPSPIIDLSETSGTASNDGIICAGDQVKLTASDGTSYIWSNGQTTPSITVSPNVTKTYTVEVTNANGCKARASKEITVNALPSAEITSSYTDNKFCAGSNVTFAANTGMSIYQFMVGGSPVQTGTTNAYTTSSLVNGNVVSVMVTDANGCSATSLGITNTVYPLPETASGSDVERCGAGEITLSATPGNNGNTIRWYDTTSNGTLEYTGNDLTRNFDSTTTYYAESYNTATGCAAEQRKEIRGIVVTQAQINQNPQNSIICNNGITSFSVIASNAKSYQWEVRKAGTAVWVPILEAGSNPTYAGWDTNTLTLSDVPSSQNGNTYRCIVGSTPCEDKISEEALLQVSNIEVIPTVSNVNCKGSLTGTINAQIKNGIGNYSVTLKKNGETISTKNNISDTAKFTGLGAGIYSLEVTDGALCSKVVDNIQVLEPEDSLAASISAFSYPKCFGSMDGSIAIQARGGWEHFTYEINGEDHGTNWLFDSLGAGDYSIKVTDQNGCSKTLEQTLTEPTKLAISKKSSVDPKCYGQNSGQIQLGATGGTKSYEFRVGELSQADSSFTGIAAGIHRCFVIDANSCKDSIEVTLLQPDPVGYSIDRSDYHGYDIACFGGTDSITITPSGGKPPYAIDFDGSISSLSGEGKSFKNLDATHSYNFTIEDRQGCTVSNTVNLSQPDKLRVSSFETTNATCFGLANGTVVVDSIGGVAPYEFVLKNSKGVIVKQETGNSFACDSLPASDYSLDIMDANNCSISAAFSIVEPPILEATIAVTDVTCFGGSDGSAVAAVAGGTFPYIYQWLNESGNEVGTSATLSNVKASDYRVKITDSNGCSGVSGQTGYIEQVASIHNPPSKLAFTADVTPVACNGGSTGVIKVEPTGGWGSYEFGTTKNSFTTNNSITGLASGWYKIYVRDSLSCIDSADVMVGEQTSLVIDNISFTDVTCNGGNDGTVQVTVSGGVPNYRYYLDENEFSGSKDDLVARDYTITVKDANGCSTFGKLTINQPEAISYTSEVKNSTCGLYDGYIKVNPSGGTGTLTVLWESSGTVGNSLTGIKSGNYPFTITDGVGCRSRSFSQSVSDEGGPDINLNNITNPLCYNGSDGAVSVEITSGTLPVKYKIYFEGIAKDSAIVDSLPFSKTYNDLKQGEYNVTAVDFNGCCTDKSFTITSPTDLLVSTSKTDVKCKGELSGSAEAIVTGGTAPYTIQWFDSSGSVVGVGSKLPNVKAGTYTVKVIDTNGCPSGGKTSTVEILEPQVELMLSIASKADVKCFGQNNGYVTLSASGGWGNYLYSSNDTAWQTSNTFDQLVAGDLNVYVKDRNGCKLSSTISINQNPPVEIDVSTTDITCFNANNGKIDIAATGGNGSYLYSINNGTTWNGSASFSNLQAGAYPIAAKDGNGCTVSGGNVNISEPDKLELQISGFTPLNCFGDANAAVELQATGGVSNYQFSKNSESFVSESSFIGLSAGSYTFNVKDGNGCIATISKNIENPKKLSLSVSDYSDVSCYGGSNGSITLSATGGTPEYAFSINDSSAQPDATFGNLMAGDYSLKVVDANGCEASASKAISQPASPLTLSVANYSDVSCYGKNDGKVVLLASGGTYPYSYSMGDGTFVSTSTFTALVASSGYSFTAKDSKGCTATVSKAISEPDELLIASANVKDPTCFSYTDGKVDVTVSGGTNPYTYLWSNGSSLATTGLIKAGTYSLQVTDKNGCKYSQAFTLLNPEKISPTLPEVAIICSNQTLTLDAGYSGLSHKWTSDNGFASSDQVVTLSKAGNYYLTVTDSKGCFGVDAVHLITRDIEIEADFLLPDEASLADTIVAIDISWPLPDSIKWVYHPDTFWQLNNTDWSVYLLPQQVGNHTVGIITYLMGCCATLDKTIAIGPYSENTKEITGGLSIIKDVQSYPNPSNGHFYVLVDLNSEAEVTLEIYAIYGKKITHETAKGQSHYKFDVNIRPIPGIYLLRISSGNEFKTFRMIVQ